MSLFTKLANAIFSPVDDGGNKRSVANGDAQRWGTELERLTSTLALSVNASVIKATLADLNAVSSAYEDGAIGLVITDPSEPLRGVYKKVSGGWVKQADLPHDVATAAAEQAVLNAEQTALDRAAAELAKDIAAGYASDAVSQGNVPIYATLVGMAAIEIPDGINAVRLNGYYDAGDGGGALYKIADVEPPHGGKFQSADGAWWEIVIDQPGVHVGMFGAVGDGVTDDRAAFDAMQVVTGGTIICLDKRYNLDGWATVFDKLNLNGARKPKFTVSDTDLVDGTILLGYMAPRVQNASVTNFGVVGQLYVDPAIGTTGERIHARDLALLGEHDGFSSGLSTSHGFTFEGYDETDVADIEVARHYYGVVCKSRNGTVANIRGRLNYGCTVFIKSDTPDFAGDVANAQVSSIVVSDVQVTAHTSNAVHDAVQVYGSTLPVFAVRVDGVTSTSGKTALTVIGNGTDAFAANVRASSIRCSGGQRAYALEGTSFDCGYVDVFAENTALPPVFVGSAFNFSFGTTTVLNSDAGLTYQDVFAVTAGATGIWSVVNVRGGPGAGMLLNYDKALVTGGSHSGNVAIAGEQAPAMGAGWISGPPGYATLAVTISAQGLAQLTGVVQANSGRAGFVCTLAVGARPPVATDIACIVSGVPGAARVYTDGSVQMLSTVADADLISFAGSFKL